MVFWTAILVGALFVWLAIRLGLFETWDLLFNSVISIYVAIFLAPAVAACAPSTGTISAFCTALSLTVLAGGCFAILHGISYVFLTGQFRVSFPATFDILLAGALGFLTGFLILSFVALVLTTTPLAEHELVSGLGLNPKSEKSNIACIAWCCDRVHAVVGGDADGSATQAAIERLWDRPPQAAPDRDTDEGDVSEPVMSRESSGPR